MEINIGLLDSLATKINECKYRVTHFAHNNKEEFNLSLKLVDGPL